MCGRQPSVCVGKPGIGEDAEGRSYAGMFPHRWGQGRLVRDSLPIGV